MGEMKKILMLLSNAFDPDPRVHREALTLVAAGYQVTILCWDRDRKCQTEQVIDGISLRRIHVTSTHGRGAGQIFYLAAFWGKAFAVGRKLSFDIVHAHDFDTLPLGYALARAKGAKLVYDSHESYVDMVHNLPSVIRKSIWHSENFLLKRVDLVITVGDILKEFLQERGARNVCVVGNWQDPEQFVFVEQELAAERERLGIRPGQKVIAFIANLGAERRIPELIAAVSQTPDAFLILGGNGPGAEQAKAAAATCTNIAYLGYVQPQRVPFYTTLADIVFYSFDPANPNARFSAPNKLFECLAAGKAMLTGDFGEIGRIVRELHCGVILPDYEAMRIRAAIEDLSGEVLNEYSRNARRAAEERYSWPRAAEILLANYPAKR
jgi:glycosyltransferase involved in cell wall biosynthesis